MDILDFECMHGFIRLCADGWEQGWHERNGGNLSYRLKDEEAVACKPFFDTSRNWVPLKIQLDTLAGEHFLVTGSGKYFRNVAICPQENSGIIEISPGGDAYRIVWGLENGAVPTSELPTHLMNHAVRMEATDGANRVIYHAHPPAVIAMTYVLPLTAGDFSRALWRSATECVVVFPRGVGVVPWMVPGGAEIAKATGELMKEYSAAVWAQHGLFCSGADFDECFGLMHTIEKAADIYMRVTSSGQPILQTITDDNLRAIARDFSVEINEALLVPRC
jgi:rhamnulose-1-phosphate aldolase